MGYRVKGTLKLPDGTPATNAEIEFISRKNFSPLVQELKSNIKCSATGAYDVTLEYGEYAVIVYPGGTYPAALGTIILSADTVAGQDLPTLLQQADWQPATPEYIQQIAQWLAEANASAASSTASASAAKVSETSAKASASTVASAIVTHEGKAGAHPIGGVMGLQAALDGKYSPTNKPTAADIQNVVSPVSSGGIIELGSNANGEYVKFADGTMICTLKRNMVWGATAIYASLHQASITWSYPAIFSSTPSVSCGGATSANGASWCTVSGVPTSEVCSLRYLDVVARESETIFTMATAIGRWK